MCTQKLLQNDKFLRLDFEVFDHANCEYKEFSYYLEIESGRIFGEEKFEGIDSEQFEIDDTEKPLTAEQEAVSLTVWEVDR
ncbi:MAG: hypothetical protein R2883_05075 [Caldisericia bacterium]